MLAFFGWLGYKLQTLENDSLFRKIVKHSECYMCGGIPRHK